MGSLGKFLHRYFIPSHANSYRPHILRRSSILFFIAVIFVSEGMFVSSMFASEGISPHGVSFAAAASAVQPGSPLQTVGRELIKFVDGSKPAVPWVLGAVTVLLTIAVLSAFFIHVQIQHPQMLMSGALVALSAILLIATNAQIAGAL